MNTMNENESIKKVTMDEANAFLDMKRRFAPRIANATFLCIICPMLLVILSTMAEDNKFGITEQLASGIGIVCMFLLIAVAVIMFITSGMGQNETDHLEKEDIDIDDAVAAMVKEKRREFSPSFTKGIAGGVVLCILSVLPLIIAGIMEAPDYVCGLLVGVLLLTVAIGVNIIIRVSIIKSSYDALLQEGDYSTCEKKANKKLDEFSGVYWCFATVIYLLWSFISNDWHISWVVWPVAGVLYGAISGIVKMMMGTK